jgi:hypothetical protein
MSRRLACLLMAAVPYYGLVGLRQSGSLGCCVWLASRFRPPCNKKKQAWGAYNMEVTLQVTLHIQRVHGVQLQELGTP